MAEGSPSRVDDDETLRRASGAFGDIYDWPTEVKDGQLDAEHGASTSGGPPYDVSELTPHKAFGFPGVTMSAVEMGVVVPDELVVHGWDLSRATGQPYRPLRSNSIAPTG